MKNLSEYECLQCGTSFLAYSSERERGGAKFCSTECGYENKRRRTMVTCGNCGNEFETRIYELERGQGKCCSRECAGEWLSKNFSGENSPIFRRKQSVEHMENVKNSVPRGRGHYRWQGGFKMQDGYKRVKKGSGYQAEHRMIAEKALGRSLETAEEVHHINGNKADNRNSNLLICTKSYHRWLEAKMSFLYKQEHFGNSCLKEGV